MGSGSSRQRRQAEAQPRQYPQAPQYYAQPQTNGQMYGGFQQQSYHQPMPPPQPPPPPPAVERTTKTATIRNHVNVKKTSVSCSAANPFSPNKLKISFKFDANLPCHSSVFVLAIEDRSAPGNALSQKVNAPGSAPRRVAHEKGLGQTYETAFTVDVSPYSLAELTSDNPDGPYAIVIRLECVTGGASAVEDVGTAPVGAPGCAQPSWVQHQTTFCKLRKRDDGSWGVIATKQKISVDGKSYELQEIFGIENCATGNPMGGGGGGGGGGDEGKECVVCLSEPRDTTVLPCRHMCMCGGCARELRHQSNKCPVCRSPVESLLEIKIADRDGGAAAS